GPMPLLNRPPEPSPGVVWLPAAVAPEAHPGRQDRPQAVILPDRRVARSSRVIRRRRRPGTPRQARPAEVRSTVRFLVSAQRAVTTVVPVPDTGPRLRVPSVGSVRVTPVVVLVSVAAAGVPQDRDRAPAVDSGREGIPTLSPVRAGRAGPFPAVPAGPRRHAAPLHPRPEAAAAAAEAERPSWVRPEPKADNTGKRETTVASPALRRVPMTCRAASPRA